MKKIILLVCILLSISLVYAKGETLKQGQDIDIKNDILVCCQNINQNSKAGFSYQNQIGCEDIVEDSKCGQLRLQLAITGLENAMLRVRNQETAQHLYQVMEKINESKRLNLNKLEDLEITEENGIINAKGKNPARFLNLFRLRHSYNYRISEAGDVTRQKRFFDFLWKDIEETS